MSEDISQSAPLDSICAYLKRVNGLSDSQAQHEAELIVANFEQMQRRGYIDGWYFDQQGHLDLIPSDDALHRMDEK
ncbi:hypothetical protein [Ferrimonas senticii]|uniref:hypothetical protein n=1 Tax=Ferrimonas senticii TaxID=394566 RepID=UPI0003F8F62A|nr:hypothetical protein [Ferrimonas senticii]